MSFPAPPDPALAPLVEALRAGDLDLAEDPPAVRAKFDAMLAQIPVADDVDFGTDRLDGVAALTARTPGAAPDHALLYLHGGGYISGSAQGYRALAAELGRAAGAVAFAIDYRLAPEHRFPAAIDDAVAAYRALLARGIAADRIVIAGDSAGGGLTVAALVALRDAGDPLPAAGVAISPWADLACDAPSYAARAAADPSLTPDALRACARHYLGDTDPRDPRASPVNADLAGLPPLLIQAGSAEILHDDALALARAAAAGDVAVRLELWPGMVHVWHAFGFMLDSGRHAVASAGDFMRSAFAARRS